MKTKNLILGLLAFVFAIGTAFTSKTFLGPDAWVVVRHSPAGDWDCVKTSVQCDFQGEFTCRIRVITIKQPSTRIVTARDALPYCSTPLKSYFNVPYYDHLDPEHPFYDALDAPLP